MNQNNELFILSKSNENRPEKFDFEDKIQELITSLESFNNYTYCKNLEDCYDNIETLEGIKGGIYPLLLTASNPIDIQILESLMKLCYKTKNPLKVLEIVESLLIVSQLDL